MLGHHISPDEVNRLGSLAKSIQKQRDKYQSDTSKSGFLGHANHVASCLNALDQALDAYREARKTSPSEIGTVQTIQDFLLGCRRALSSYSSNSGVEIQPVRDLFLECELECARALLAMNAMREFENLYRDATEESFVSVDQMVLVRSLPERVRQKTALRKLFEMHMDQYLREKTHTTLGFQGGAVGKGYQ